MAPAAKLANAGLCLLAVCVLAGFSAANAQSTRPSFNYTQGGSDWGGLCNNGTSQSPINLRMSRATNSTRRVNNSLGLEYNTAVRNYSVVNKGQTIELAPGEGNYMTLPTIFYNPSTGSSGSATNSTTRLLLLQTHFHEPSEHFFEGTAYPLEQHFVHNDTVRGQIAVFGVFYKIDDEEVPNPYLNQMFNYAPTRYNGEFKVTNETMNLAAWPPVNGSNFFHYNGSLTTPPCTENILWFVLDTPLTMSSAQLQQYQRLTNSAGGDRGDNRPLQRVGNRTLTLFT